MTLSKKRIKELNKYSERDFLHYHSIFNQEELDYLNERFKKMIEELQDYQDELHFKTHQCK
jgi:nitrate/nitrite-specific signal transduction histidine kinase